VISFLKSSLPFVRISLSISLAIATLLFLLRIILSWYPKVNSQKGFWLIISAPTEPILSISRKIVPPIGGVDVTPVIWVGLLSLFRELIVSQQGILSLIQHRINLIG
tara:strand:- start:30281 stop:30601 length:321 start_codon:yes stop_codon:yes gene_type:complete